MLNWKHCLYRTAESAYVRSATALVAGLLASAGAGLLSGCGVSANVAAVPVSGVALRGSVHGGQQPVSNSTIQLYAVNTTTDGGAATALLLATNKTGADGGFSITGTYICPSASSLVYLTAVGGNPGLLPANTNNASLSMMAALGTCGNLKPTTNISINEVTTVAAVWPLSAYMNSYAAVGSSAANASALASAFTLAGQFANASTGTTPGSVPAGYSAPTSEINTLADILASCINSTGGVAGDSTTCGMLFTAATPSGGTAPTDTVGAAISIARNPNQNVAAVFALANASGPFQPTMTTAPADWTVPLLPTNVNRILFVGDSFTHARYLPSRTYNSANVTDENYGFPAANPRAESTTEPGPYGGIPGVFKMLTTEAGLNYDVHIDTVSSSSLNTLYSLTGQVIANAQWNSIVLQELSDKPIPRALSGSTLSAPSSFCSSVKTLEQAIHAANPTASVYLYETWARAEEVQALGAATYATNLVTISNSYHNVFYRAAVLDGKIAGVAAVGDAWLLAMQNGVATANPYTSTTGPFLWYGLNATNNPSIATADYHHPSVYGVYLSALVLYGQITGQDPALLGASEQAAVALGISSSIAVQLQGVAHTQIYSGSTAPINQTGDPCTVTQ